MENVRAKKHFGQHFLKDEGVAAKIVESLTEKYLYKHVFEIGPGMGVLTKYLLQEKSFTTSVIDIDKESIAYLKTHYPALSENIIEGDFLLLDLSKLFHDRFAVIGNFPYNISSQILFKVLEHKDQMPVVVGMFQKEVAERIASKPGPKTYGILSVFLQSFYTIEYLFTVEPTVFNPPPKVKSAVIRLIRNDVKALSCDEKLFMKIVKAGFNQRRKTLRNALKQFKFRTEHVDNIYLPKRAEQLSVKDFTALTNMIEV